MISPDLLSTFDCPVQDIDVKQYFSMKTKGYHLSGFLSRWTAVVNCLFFVVL